MSQRFLPDFIIFGAQKSGTTFLQKCLQNHPEIYLPQIEIPFFESPDYENSKKEDLERYFLKTDKKTVKGIKRPNYLCKPEVPPRINQIVPDVKLILLVRDPIERAISAYFHYIKYGFLPAQNIEFGMNDIINDNYKEHKRAHEVIDFGLYHKYLNKYLKHFSMQNIFIVEFSTFFDNKKQYLEEIFQFLNVDKNYKPTNLDIRPQKVTYNINRLKFIRNINSNLFEYFDDGKRLKVKKKNIIDISKIKLFKFVDENILDMLVSNDKPCISNNLYMKMRNIYLKDIDKFKYRTNIDCSDWLNYEKYRFKYC